MVNSHVYILPSSSTAELRLNPKLYTVPVQQQQLCESNSSPAFVFTRAQVSSQPKRTPPRTKATKVKGGGLAHGTGRIRPAVNRLESTASKNRSSPPAPSQQPPSRPSKSAPQPKLRTVIDQGPIPLYCSDECRLKDLSRLDDAFSINYNPNSTSPASPARATQFLRPFDYPLCHLRIPPSTSRATHSTHTSAKPSPPDPRHLHDYQNGVMMSAKRIQAALCAAQSTERPRFNEPQPPRKPIPGCPWLGGKAVLCCLHGAQWSSSNLDICKSSSSLPRLGRSEADQLDVKVVPLSRCLEPPTSTFAPSTSCPSQSLPPLPPTSTTSTSTRRCRNNLLVKAGGRLLVLNVTVLPHHVSEDSMLNEERSTSDSVLSQPSASVRTYPVMMPPPGKGKRIMTRITLSKDTLYTPDSFCSLTMVGTATRTRDLFSCLISLYSASHTSP
ncbi:hypothetical protein EV401DRAFT_2136786 [Pisolithus croceorrhizus]|nr:hypothetical protein EV401DRAFT_2136786 [Pisolithus croceorrhizus]